METKHTWIYCRAAYNEPDADVLAMQQRRLETYAKEHGFEIVGSSSDMGNGLTLDRSGLSDFRATAENGKVDILLTANLSFLRRDTDKVKQINIARCSVTSVSASIRQIGVRKI